MWVGEYRKVRRVARFARRVHPELEALIDGPLYGWTTPPRGEDLGEQPPDHQEPLDQVVLRCDRQGTRQADPELSSDLR